VDRAVDLARDLPRPIGLAPPHFEAAEPFRVRGLGPRCFRAGVAHDGEVSGDDDLVDFQGVGRGRGLAGRRVLVLSSPTLVGL
jgi:hypothetical protein